MTPTEWAGLITAMGVPVIVVKLLDGIQAKRSGKAEEEKARNKTLLARLTRLERAKDAAEEALDVETLWRRQIQEWAARLVVRLILRGEDPASIEPEPERPE